MSKDQDYLEEIIAYGYQCYFIPIDDINSPEKIPIELIDKAIYWKDKIIFKVNPTEYRENGLFSHHFLFHGIKMKRMMMPKKMIEG
jgi:hypothetical protein